MKRRLLAALVLCIVIGSGCAPMSIQTDIGRVSYTADQIVIRLGAVQNTVIAVCAAGPGPTCTGPISTPASRTFVQFIVDATKVLKASPGGWQAAVLTAWTQAKGHPELQAPSVQGYVLTIDALLGAAP